MRSVSVEEAVAMIHNGATIMVGGFLAVGTSERLVDELIKQHKSQLNVIRRLRSWWRAHADRRRDNCRGRQAKGAARRQDLPARDGSARGRRELKEAWIKACARGWCSSSNLWHGNSFL